jgi:hypothetical protein
MKNASYFQNIAVVEIRAPVGFMMLNVEYVSTV